MSQRTPTGGWSDPDQVEWYRARIGRLDARLAGEAALVDLLPPHPRRLLDLGCGDGRLAAVVMDARPEIERAVLIDRSEPMLALASDRFADDERVVVVPGDLNASISSQGRFDAIVSGFAIHHLDDGRKRGLLDEIVDCLDRPGCFLNLEVVASATPARHAEFLAAIGRTHDDPEDRLSSIDAQLRWMREAGLENVDCLWRWRGFALLAGELT